MPSKHAFGVAAAGGQGSHRDTQAAYAQGAAPMYPDHHIVPHGSLQDLLYRPHACQISACGVALSAKGPGAILGYAASAPARTRCGSGWRRTRRSGRTRARRCLSATTCAQWTAAAARPATRSLRKRHAELRWSTHLLPDTSDAHTNLPAGPERQQPSARAMGLALHLEHSSAWASVGKQGAAEPQH